MRDYLRANSVEFDERNIRHSEEARAELEALTGNLVVPLLVAGDTQIVGYDPDALSHLVATYTGATG